MKNRINSLLLKRKRREATKKKEEKFVATAQIQVNIQVPAYLLNCKDQNGTTRKECSQWTQIQELYSVKALTYCNIQQTTKNHKQKVKLCK